MPVYEYICLKCNLKFDFLVRSTGEVILCPKCAGKDLKKLVSSFAFNSKDASGNITSSSSGCGSCSSHNCASCAG